MVHEKNGRNVFAAVLHRDGVRIIADRSAVNSHGKDALPLIPGGYASLRTSFLRRPGNGKQFAFNSNQRLPPPVAKVAILFEAWRKKK